MTSKDHRPTSPSSSPIIPPHEYEDILDETGDRIGFRVKGYKPEIPEVEKSSTKWKVQKDESGTETKVSYTVASNRFEKESSIQGMIVLDSLNDYEEFEKRISRGEFDAGSDQIAIFIRVSDAVEQRLHMVGSIRDLRIRSEKDSIFIESDTGRIAVLPVFGSGDRVRVRRRDRAVPQWDTTEGEYEEMTFAEFIQKRERRRQRDESSLIPNRGDHLARSIIGRASASKVKEKTSEILAEQQRSDSSLDWVWEKATNADGKPTHSGKRRLRLDPARAYEIAVGLTDESRRYAANLSTSGKSRKTATKIETTVQAILPFDKTATRIEPNTSGEQVLEELEKAHIASLYRSLSPRHLQVHLAIFGEAMRHNGAFLLDKKGKIALAEKMGIDLKKVKYSGAELKQLEQTLEDLSRFSYVLEIRQEGTGAMRLDAPILQWEYTATKVDEQDEKIEEVKVWRVNDKVREFFEKKRSFALVDDAFFLLDAKRETWEIQILLYISSRWSKGWLGDEKLSKVDGRFETTIGSVLHGAGLSLAAFNMIEHDGRPSLRKKVREVFENLRRCGPDRVDAIGGFGISPDPKDPDDPLSDRVWIEPSKGQIDRFREKFLGRAESKMLQVEQAPPKPPKRRGRPKKTEGDKSATS